MYIYISYLKWSIWPNWPDCDNCFAILIFDDVFKMGIQKTRNFPEPNEHWIATSVNMYREWFCEIYYTAFTASINMYLLCVVFLCVFLLLLFLNWKKLWMLTLQIYSTRQQIIQCNNDDERGVLASFRSHMLLAIKLKNNSTLNVVAYIAQIYI